MATFSEVWLVHSRRTQIPVKQISAELTFVAEFFFSGTYLLLLLLLLLIHGMIENDKQRGAVTSGTILVSPRARC